MRPVRRRAATTIVATGVVLSLLPWLLDADGSFDGAGDYVFVVGLIAMTVLPFVLLAVFGPHLPEVVTWGVFGLLVVVYLAQIAATTTDASSTGAIGYLLLPVYGLLLVGIGVVGTSVTRRLARKP